MTEVASSPIPFSDAAELYGEKNPRVRPWAHLWPPKDQQDLQKWMKTDTPEVLNWRFDPQNSFNRPWRQYTKSELAKTEAPYSIMPVNDPVPPPSEDKGKISPKRNH